MNTNYNDEETRFDNVNNAPENTNEETQFEPEATEQATEGEEIVEESSDNQDGEKKGSVLKKMGVGAGAGLLIGGVTTVLMGMKADDHKEDNHKDELTHPEWVDDKIPVATTVNDDMSFGQAFAAAREEVGPGGCFEWRGQLYGTYTADEWNHMSDAEKAEYASHFSWNQIDSSSSQVHHNQQNLAQNNDDDIPVVSVDHENKPSLAQNDETHTEEGHTPDNGGEEVVAVVDPAGTVPPEPEIEIIGVIHDDETGANIGGMLVDNQEVVLIDVDNDITFDYMVVDANADGIIQENEIVDISGQNLTVNDLGGFTNPADGMLTNDSTSNFDDDVPVDC